MLIVAALQDEYQSVRLGFEFGQASLADYFQLETGWHERRGTRCGRCREGRASARNLQCERRSRRRQIRPRGGRLNQRRERTASTDQRTAGADQETAGRPQATAKPDRIIEEASLFRSFHCRYLQAPVSIRLNERGSAGSGIKALPDGRIRFLRKFYDIYANRSDPWLYSSSNAEYDLSLPFSLSPTLPQDGICK